MKKLGRPNLGKTLTIKKRAVYAYLPTEKMRSDWKRDAERNGLSLSDFIVKSVESSRRLFRAYQRRMKQTQTVAKERQRKKQLEDAQRW